MPPEARAQEGTRESGLAQASVAPPPDPGADTNRSESQLPLDASGPKAEDTITGALPREWDTLWAASSAAKLPVEGLVRLRDQTAQLAQATPLTNHSSTFGSRVGAAELRDAPIHRWYSYKEGFSPCLPGAVLNLLPALGDDLLVADVFGGVATTALALQPNPRVSEVRSIEYSPFAAFVGQTKLRWRELDVKRLRGYVGRLLDYSPDNSIVPPGLAAFSNPQIFSPVVRTSLLSAREHITMTPDLAPLERDFFLLGLAAVIEDASGAMKDGRALRIRRTRRRTPSSLGQGTSSLERDQDDEVKRLLAGQWGQMLDDLLEQTAQLVDQPAATLAHIGGNARDMGSILLPSGEPAFPDSSVDLFLFSPPYLNFIDYTEVYKLELWMLGHVTDQAAFREMRLGTLRSHPSVKFEETDAFAGWTAPVVQLVDELAGWISQYGARREVGPVVRQYFEDMFRVYQGQAAALKKGGASVCVVANSTFSRRRKTGSGPSEDWRLPVLTDVLLAHLALLAGFDDVELWEARELRPRNVRSGRARESLVVAQKR